jgi:hypothetical protein
MDINFHEQFIDHTNLELLTITKRPGDYQPAAVAAAYDILRQRAVTPAEIIAAEEYAASLGNSQRNEKLEAYKQKAADFLEPVLKPSAQVAPKKWLNIFLVIIAVQYLWTFYLTVKYTYRIIARHGVVFDYVLMLELLTLVYIPFLFYLLFTRKKWGWILLFGENVFIVLTSISQAYIYFRYRSVTEASIVGYLWPIILRSFFLFFLWKNEIAHHFNVTPELKKKTLAWVAGGTVVFIILVNLMFG